MSDFSRKKYKECFRRGVIENMDFILGTSIMAIKKGSSLKAQPLDNNTGD